MMRIWQLGFLLLGCCHIAGAQVQRTYSDHGVSVKVLVQNNRMENNFGFPGMNAFIIIGGNGLVPENIYSIDKIRTMPVSGMNDYACFYYVSADEIRHFSSFKTFLTGFIDWCYRTDYIDRNTTTVVWQGPDSHLVPCAAWDGLNTIAAGIYILDGTEDMACTRFIAPSANYIWQKNKKSKTAIHYPVPGLADVEQTEEEEHHKRFLAGFDKKRGDVFFQVTGGRHEISKNCRTGFDTSTLVDFTRFKTLWNISTGYYITNRLFFNAELAFIYSGKKKQVDRIDWNGGSGITVTGSGYAGAMIRYGIGLGWLPYHNNRIDIITSFSLGRLNTFAAGGGGTKTVGGGSSNMDIVKEKRQTNYCNLMAGFNYRLSSTFYFTANFQYNFSKLDQPVGSVSAFTGWSLNAGLGLIIPTKSKDNDKR
jgi:hypothetical protein